MKYFFLIIGSVLLSSCIYSEKQYTITRIDQVNDIHIIYATKNDTLFKIVSLKDSLIDIKCHKVLSVGRQYEFNLKSIVFDSITPINIDGVYFYNELIELERDLINDIYISSNIKGLCFLNNDDDK